MQPDRATNSDPLGERAAELIRTVRDAVSDLIRIDPLTGLRNKRALKDVLEAKVTGEDAFWCAFIELDKFKAVNTKHGYAAADGLLLNVGLLLTSVGVDKARAEEAFRAHGDEFYLVGSNVEMAETILEAVRAEVSAYRVSAPDGEEMSCTCSIGWTSVGIDDVSDRGTLMLSLERAVDEAKWQGRDRVVRFHDGLKKLRTVEVRQECNSCTCRFSVDLPFGFSKKFVYCPSCNTNIQLSSLERDALFTSEVRVTNP